MEKEQSCSNYGLMMEMSTEQLTNCYFHTNWGNSNDQNDPFESALSSMVSSPTTTQMPSSSNGCGDGMMIRELIGRLGSICDSSGEITGGNNSSTNTSCYNTPLNSPPPSKFNLSSLMIMGSNPAISANASANYPANLGSFNADPGFVERAAKFSCFGNASNFGNVNSNINQNFSSKNGVNRSVTKLESEKLSRANSENKMINNNNNSNGGISVSTPGNNGDSRESSSVSEQNPGVELPCKPKNDANSRKRKSIPKAKLKDSTLCPSSTKDDKVENEESDAKRSKVDNELNKKENAGECNSSKEKHNSNNNNDNNNDRKEAEKAEPPKDYIHVRARRGQATDSHSLAERVRREKISERMKFLQDLVPGCNKVTGKATVLDEIINYVQSLQRQVEFLSMKLSTANPRAEYNMEALLSKDLFQSRGSPLSQTMYPLDQNSAQEFPFVYQSTQQMPLSFPNGVPNGFENPFSVGTVGIRQNRNVPLPSINGFADSLAQLPTLWEDDLQSIVQMGIVPNQTQSVPGEIQLHRYTSYCQIKYKVVCFVLQKYLWSVFYRYIAKKCAYES